MAQQTFKKYNVPTKGLYTSAAADLISNDYTPWCQNVRFRFGKVVKAPGRSVTLATPDPGLTVLDFFQYVDTSGLASYGCLTAVGSAGSAWVYDPVACNFPTKIGPLPSGFQNPDGSYSRYSWTDGEEQVFVVRNSQIYALRKIGAAWSGGVLTGAGITNGVPAPACRLVEYFNNSVFAMNIQGVPNRLQWSARGEYRDWLTSVDPNGYHGGFLDLYDGYTEPITGGKVLNDRLVCYRRRSITDIIATGDEAAPFLPQGRAYGIGCAAPWTLQSVGQFHIFLANDWNVYTWDGAQLQIIGTPVHSYIRRVIDTTKLESGAFAAFAAVFMGFKEYWLVFPAITGGAIVLIYDYLRDSWTRDVFLGLSALYEILERNKVGSAGYSETNYPIKWPMMMAGVGQDFCLVDERVDGDRYTNPTTGVTECLFDSPDVYIDPTSALINGTIERVMVSQDQPAAPTDPSYNVEISIDRGLSFPVLQQVTPKQTAWGFQFADFNVTSNVYRLRFHFPTSATVAPNPSWRSYTVVYLPAGEFFPVDRPIGTTRVQAFDTRAGES